MHEEPGLSSPIISIERFKTMYDRASLLAGMGVWECDLDSQALAWTDGVYDLFGYGRGSLVDRASTVALYHDESRAEMERLRAQAIAGGGGFMMDARIRTMQGGDRWMVSAASAPR
ncbi:hypothetical protein BH10PSE12_BH10PSE12_06220 [soil metagenome]